MKVIFLLMCWLTFVPALTYMVVSDGPRLKVIDWGYDGFQQQGWGAERLGAAGAGRRPDFMSAGVWECLEGSPPEGSEPDPDPALVRS